MRKKLSARATQTLGEGRDGRGARTGLLEVAEDEEVELRRREHPHGRTARARAPAKRRRTRRRAAAEGEKEADADVCVVRRGGSVKASLGQRCGRPGLRGAKCN